MSTTSAPAEQRIVLGNISWSTYVALLEDSGARRGRMTYDQGELEIMSPSKTHENTSRLIGRMVEAFTEELGIGICSVKSTTFKRADQRRGFEADESYYIKNASAVRDKDEIDLLVDPPPDLAIEIDISSSSLSKFAIYGGLGVPELWRYVGASLHVYLHRDGEAYDEVNESSVLPRFPFDQLAVLLAQRTELDETELIRRFRSWVRDQLSAGC